MSEHYLECISGPELDRLKSQHEAWLPETIALIRDAKFSSCRKILEVGCGPGFTALEIAGSINPSATITATDVSAYYLNHLRKEVQTRNLSNVTVVEANLMEECDSLGEHDAVFCRWFLIWVTRGIDCALANIHRSLRSGGIFAAMEYLTLRSACQSPACPALSDYIRAWESFYSDCGGTTELGSSLAEKLVRNGFEIVEMRCVGGYAPKGDRIFAWWRRLFEDFHLRFYEKGYLSAESIDSLKDSWQACDRDPDASSGIQGNGDSGAPSISDDGRYVTFWSEASNLVAGDTNSVRDVFVRDLQSSTTTRVSVDSLGTQADNESYVPIISGNGRFVTYQSTATNLVVNDTNGKRDVFVFDRETGGTIRVSVGASGIQANDNSYVPHINMTGTAVVFDSEASNLVAGDTNGTRDVFVHDIAAGKTTLISKSSTGEIGNQFSRGGTISDNGRYVAFESAASNLVANDNGGNYDVFVRDRQLETTKCVSFTTFPRGGTSPEISGDGKWVVFVASSSFLGTNSNNFTEDIFISKWESGEIKLVTSPANGQCTSPSVSTNGTFVSFGSFATNLTAGDSNTASDVFLRDRSVAEPTATSTPTTEAPTKTPTPIPAPPNGEPTKTPTPVSQNPTEPPPSGDTTPPNLTLKAFKGKSGTKVVLSYSVSDASNMSAEKIRILKGKKVLKVFFRKMAKIPKSGKRSVTYSSKAGDKGKGTVCIYATDSSGNTCAEKCVGMTLS